MSKHAIRTTDVYDYDHNYFPVHERQRTRKRKMAAITTYYTSRQKAFLKIRSIRPIPRKIQKSAFL